MDTRELIPGTRNIIYIFLQKEPSFICLDNSEIPPERKELMVLKKNLFYYKKKKYTDTFLRAITNQGTPLSVEFIFQTSSAQKPSFLELEISSIWLKKAVTF